MENSCLRFQDGSPVVIVAGGMDEHKQALSSVEILILGGSRSRWLRLGDTLAPRKMYPAVAVLGNRLTVAAGTVGNGTPIFVKQFPHIFRLLFLRTTSVPTWTQWRSSTPRRRSSSRPVACSGGGRTGGARQLRRDGFPIAVENE